MFKKALAILALGSMTALEAAQLYTNTWSNTEGVSVTKQWGDAANWSVAYETKDNHQRLVRGAIGKEVKAMRLVPLSTYFSELKEIVFDSAVAHIFAFEPV